MRTFRGVLMTASSSDSRRDLGPAACRRQGTIQALVVIVRDLRAVFDPARAVA
ncbi:MAG TPA: hypothetical protein VLT86_07185 [Vicinamibacterales bacterium]|nr:hypothetical protein [Vicinamibacterales bacterium]